MWILTTVLNWFGGGIADKLLQAWIKGKDSKVESERIEAEWAKAQLDAMLQVRLATSSFWEMRLITALIAGCFTLHLILVTLDTVTTGTWLEIAGWSVPPFPTPFNEWQGAILLSFFGIYTVGKGLSTIAGTIAARKAAPRKEG